MKAMVIKDFGGPEVFEAREVPKPEPRAGELLVRVHATSVNPVDYKIRQAGSWAGIEPPAVIGYDVSGVVEATGPDVQNFAAGDEVFYTPEISQRTGSYAAYNLAHETIVAPKPVHLTHAEAASLPLAGGTAWDALIERARLTVGETVLVHGTGGVGSMALQIARAAGARVFVTCSSYMVEEAKSMGASLAIDYRREDFADIIQQETNGAGVEVVFDTVGGETLANSIPITKPFGRMVGIVNAGGSLDAAFAKNITLHFLFLQRLRYKLDSLRKLAERGQLRPVIDSVMPLKDVAKAHQRLEEGGVKGKIVLQVVT